MRLAALLALALLALPAAAQDPWTTQRFPQDEDKAWWDAQWWERGWLPVSASYEVGSRASSFRHGDTEVAAVFRERHVFTPGSTIRLAPDAPRAHLFDAASGVRLAA